MIVVTGAAGFIGSQVALNHQDQELILVDHQEAFEKRPYLKTLSGSSQQLDAEKFLGSLSSFKGVKAVFHMGAISSTAEKSWDNLLKWNVNYSKTLWTWCAEINIPFVYASSGATYGGGENGFSDDHGLLPKLKPLNLYGKSKHEFDLWALEQSQKPPVWYGLKFFNVYGPHEDHKGRMASSIWHGYNEITKSGAMTLFKSHNPDYQDGEQSRDFVFIQDLLDVMRFLLQEKPASGLYNIGFGKAETYLNLAQTLFAALDKPENINWVDTPEQFRAAYQYKTEAQVSKLKEAGYTKDLTSLKDGVGQYLKYLRENKV